MHYTRRLLELRWSSALVLGACVTAGFFGASCSSADSEAPHVDGSDAASDVSPTPDAAAEPTPVVDAATPFDGGPLPVQCATDPCATALTTTRGRVDDRGSPDDDRGEGFCVLLRDGTVACWGAGGAGQLGRGDEATADSATAARVPGVKDIVSLDHTCAVDKNGAVFCWGTGPFLRDPVTAVTTEPSPVKLDIPAARKVAVGLVTGCALVDDGVVCWGWNQYGQIAPFESERSSAVLAPQAAAIPPGAPIDDLLVGNATFVVRADKTVVSWGANPPLARVSSLYPDPYPQPSALGSVTAIDVAEDNACAAVGGVGYCWGTATLRNYEPSIQGERPSLARALPAPVVTPEPVVRISTTRTSINWGVYPPAIQPDRRCAIGASGAVYCWGYNGSGQAGDGTKEHAYEAVRVVGLPGPAAQVKTLPGATCALLTSGKVYCWGTNFSGQLGNGRSKVPSVTPQEVVLP
ncbi:hypothetical protein AKJ09_08002 [Labilithrix luteola]|uniref:BNR repeat domain protein n=1 Tax=Labilithrix luteola TaxID=1391654 RepID=A0A0K1Q6K0_9BACT|nr:hypothetical protein [Labilithrix luteola]AKV01339.1 hypothetical protein AKJ09_08002 [Labilithrix luteola]